MARAVRIGFLVASHVLIGAIAGVGGVLYVEYRTAQAAAIANRMVLVTRAAAAVELQRSKTPVEERDALIAFLDVMDQLYKPNDPLYSETTYWTDKTLAYVRLARLEGSVQNERKATEYFANAISASAKIAWKSCTAEGLVTVSEYLDEQGSYLFGPGRNGASLNPNQPAPPGGGHDVSR